VTASINKNYQRLPGAIAAICLFAGTLHAEPLLSPDATLTRGRPVTSSGATSAQIVDRTTGDVLGVIFANPWAVKSGTGSSTVTYDGNGAVISKIKYDDLNVTGVNGYPAIGYGGDAWGFQNGGTKSNGTRLPIGLKSLESLLADTEYALSGKKYPGNLDVAFDIWLIPHLGFKGGREGAVEVMLMYYYDFAWRSPCKIKKTVKLDATVNGTPTQLSFAQHICVKGNGPGSYVAYTPLDQGNMEKARIKLDLKPLLDDAVADTGVDTSWYLAGIQFGTEYGNPGNTQSIDYQMETRHFLLQQTLKQP